MKKLSNGVFLLICVFASYWQWQRLRSDMGIVAAQKIKDILPIVDSPTMEAKFMRACMAWNEACNNKALDARTRSALYLRSSQEIEEIFRVAPGYRNVAEIRAITNEVYTDVRP